MNRLVNIKKAAEYLGVTPLTLRRWDYEGKLHPHSRTQGGQRRYDLSKLSPDLYRPNARETIGYARVSSHDQKPDLKRQEEMLEMYCSSKGWDFSIMSDLGSGMNYNKKGLKKLLDLIIEDKVGRLVLTHKDRLLRFGAELVFSICELKDVEVVIINKKGEPSFEEELAQDVLEIITVFSARLYGSRSRKNKKLMNNLKQAIDKKDG